MILGFAVKGKTHQLALEKPSGSDFRLRKKLLAISRIFFVIR